MVNSFSFALESKFHPALLELAKQYHISVRVDKYGADINQYTASVAVRLEDLFYFARSIENEVKSDQWITMMSKHARG